MHLVERRREMSRVLVVDDSADHRDLYAMALAPAYEVLTAARGTEGLTIAHDRHPDAIVLDIHMPELDGWETCRRLKSDPATADIPVILLTGNEEPHYAAHAAAVGAAAALTKPCPFERLHATLVAVMPRGPEKAVWG